MECGNVSPWTSLGRRSRSVPLVLLGIYLSVYAIMIYFAAFCLAFVAVLLLQGVWLATTTLGYDLFQDVVSWWEGVKVRAKARRMDKLRARGVGRRAARLLDAIGSAAVDAVLDDDNHQIDPILSLSIKWARKARVNFQYPSHSRANEIIVADWINKQWKGMDLRASHIDRALPLAVKLAFVKSAAERNADDLFNHFLRDYVDTASH